MISGVKTYIRTRMRELGYTEWRKGFNFQEIPITILDTRFHIEAREARKIKSNQDNDDFMVPMTVRTFLKPTVDPTTRQDTAEARIDTIAASFLKASHRTLDTGVKNVGFSGGRILPLAETDINGLIIETTFDFLVIVSTT